MGTRRLDELTFDQIVRGEGATIITLGGGYFAKELARHVRCADGTELSVQASHTHYCTPRYDHGPYSEVEVGYPSVSPPDSWAQYFDGDWATDDHTGTVYGYVPVELVREFIEAHGGEMPEEATDVPNH